MYYYDFVTIASEHVEYAHLLYIESNMNDIAHALKLAPKTATEIKILQATNECINHWGIEKTNLMDIAKQAGVTRPTVYSYFSGKDDVIRAALLHAGYVFAQKLLDHIHNFDSYQSRLLEAVFYAVKKLPQEPYLQLITRMDLSDRVSSDALSDSEGQVICLHIFEKITQGENIENDMLLEIIEITIRITLSLVMVKSPVQRDDEALRNFLKRRLMPAVALSN